MIIINIMYMHWAGIETRNCNKEKSVKRVIFCGNQKQL